MNYLTVAVGLNQMNPAHALHFPFFKINFCIIPAYALKSFKLSFQVSRPKFCISFSVFLCASHSALIHVSYDHPNNNYGGQGYHLVTKLLIMPISHVQPWPTRCVFVYVELCVNWGLLAADSWSRRPWTCTWIDRHDTTFSALRARNV